MKFILLSIILSTQAIAGLTNAPPTFKHGEKKAVFIDFLKAQYDLVYDAKGGNAEATSTIEFFMPERGHPLFDSVSTPNLVSINGKSVGAKLISVPGNVSVMRMVNAELSKGHHTLRVVTPIYNGTRFDLERKGWGDVSSGFFIRDLKDRMFLEKYLPTNYEYDQYKMEMDVKITGTKRWHSLFANGDVTKINNNHYHVSMPNFYSASSVYFHLVPIDKYVRWYLTFPSIDGRNVPVTIYSSYRFYNHYVKNKAWAVLKELEADYGPYPHDKLIIYGTGIKGGMEHAGATESSIVSLGHELQHMYFAKGIHPANGNSGWLDEAIASWRDKGHFSSEIPFYKSANLAKHSEYTRKTDKRSYEYGRSFMAYINHQLIQSGKEGLKHFLRIYFNKRKFTPVTTEIFKADLEEYAQMSFGEDFYQYIYGGNSDEKYQNNIIPKENPHHPDLTQEELDSII
ncbi:MAG: hypothetical protein ACJAS4_001626 [Bacteriovoracaceae bacterium]|jgi:hypothetical protein